jgi:hypothetical protein
VKPSLPELRQLSVSGERKSPLHAWRSPAPFAPQLPRDPLLQDLKNRGRCSFPVSPAGKDGAPSLHRFLVNFRSDILRPWVAVKKRTKTLRPSHPPPATKNE